MDSAARGPYLAGAPHGLQTAGAFADRLLDQGRSCLGIGQPVAQFAVEAGKRSPRQLSFYRPQMVRLPPRKRAGPLGPILVERTIKLLPIGAISITVRVPFTVGSLSELVTFHDLRFEDGALHEEVKELAEAVRHELLPFYIRPHPQLVEDEAYDRLLDDALERAYRDLREPDLRRRGNVLRELREFRIDLARLSDELSNITKFFGDWHLARIYQAFSVRFHLPDWHRTINGKLQTLDDLYQLLKTDQTNHWMLILEITVVVLFVIDLVLLILEISSR